ncbi:DUF4144 family protein [uncultured Shewanella sp.]|uniref:DUF4144 family protein n=1 Tax=uncultured Shewanella sp. TaxID=173975 RepID=UPI002617048E|nr:DUF4144 family protein [uncultured Shewanella sp.]
MKILDKCELVYSPRNKATQVCDAVLEKGVSSDVHWPALVCYQGDDELVYIADEAAWVVYCHEAPTLIEGEDKLIDASGQLYYLVENKDRLVLRATNRRFLLSELLILVRHHACLVQQVCSAKIDAKTHRQLIDIVYELNRVTRR